MGYDSSLIHRWFENAHTLDECFSDSAIKDFVLDKWEYPDDIYPEKTLREWALDNMSREDFPE